MPTSTPDLKRLDRFVRAAMEETKTPGVAVAVVHRRETIFAKGYGLRDTRRKLEVTPDTLFAIASCSKAFTATALGILVDEKKLDWDTPVREYLPTFRLHDPVASERTTPRDLLCHRTGLPRHDTVWYASQESRWEVLERLRHLEPSKDFRQTWQYQNLMYMVAGLVIEQLTGLTWEAFVKERILQPLGMTRTTTSVVDSQEDPDHALPYLLKRGRPSRIPFFSQWSIAPAGALNSCLTELAPWLTMNLYGGKHGRKQIVSAETLAQIHTPQAVEPDVPIWPETFYSMYALGWSVRAHRGTLTVTHGGSIDGFGSRVILLPKQKIGIVVLANLASTPVPPFIGNFAADLALGEGPAPWLRRLKDQLAKTRKAKPRRKSKRPKRQSQALAAYVGSYQHPGYGTLEIAKGKEGMTLALNGKAFGLRHRNRDVFELVDEVWSVTREVAFLTNAEGQIDRLTVPFEPSVDPIVFQRTEERARGEAK